MDKISVSRRFVTLLEILIVIAILALVGGLVSIGVNKALMDQRFNSEVSLVVDQLRLAQDLMLIMGTDVRLTFTSEKGDKNSTGLKYKLELETKIPPEIERELFRPHDNLKAIGGVFFGGDKDGELGKITVKFQSRGAVMSSGLMRLSTSGLDNPPDGTPQSYICLSGYPRHIFSEGDGEKASAKCKSAIESVTDTALTQDTFSKLADLFKPEIGAETEEEALQVGHEAEKPPASAPKKGSTSKPSAKK